ncbi:MAG: hypothetical protein KDE31_33195, partial [Caldilineaceae bacterium]|nr:hypothetical protein [Caldilineaceae bacterium]
LLPELYRWRDQQQGQKLGTPARGPLQSFLSILEQELHTLEADMEAMYDNWFIQTCDNWVVPYIADLLGIDDDIVNIDYLPFTQRRRVANTLAYRRRKGVVAILEQVLWDVTNWHIRAVEFYQLLATTQHQQHLRPSTHVLIDTRDLVRLAALDTPFASAARTVELRRLQPPNNQVTTNAAPRTIQPTEQTHLGGKYQRDNVGLYFWRLRPYPVERGHTRRCGPNFFTFHPMGRARQLFNRPQSFQALTQSAGPIHMPIQLSRAMLAADLADYRATHDTTQPPRDLPANSTYYGPDRSMHITILARQLFDLPATLATSLRQAVPDAELAAWFAAHDSALPPPRDVATPPDETPPAQIIMLEADQRWQILDHLAGLTYTITRYAAQAGETGFQVMREERAIGPAEILSVNLPASAAAQTADLAAWQHYAAARNRMLVAIDPRVGRFAFLNATPHFDEEDLRVNYTYGFSSDIGGGPYPRRFQRDESWQQTCEILVAEGCTNSPSAAITAAGAVVAANNLPYAFHLWATYCDQVLNAGGKPRGLIRLLDNGCYALTDQAGAAPLWLPPTAELALVAEDGVQPTLIGHDGQFSVVFEQHTGPLVAALARGASQAADP